MRVVKSIVPETHPSTQNPQWSSVHHDVSSDLDEHREIIVLEPEDAGMRLDAFMAKKRPEHSRTRWQEWIRDGYVSVNGVVTSVLNYRLPVHAVCTLAALPAPKVCDMTPHPMGLRVYYEDADLLVIEKPAGLVVHPGNGTHDPTLIHGLLAQCSDLSGIGGVQKPGLVHRLDKDTSGLMIIAKHDASHNALSKQFSERSVEKKYLAFVWGQPSPPFARIENLLARHPKHRTQQAVVQVGGREAITTYRTLITNGIMSVLECGLLTGRTHQIRVHCAHIGYPLIGDSVYGNGKGHSRQGLHAHRLRFQHPCQPKEINLTSPLPPDLQEVYQRIASGNGLGG